jgi:aminoglycoside 6'-N-acetyltransferase
MWWREEYEPAAIEARYGPAVDGLDSTELFIVEYDGVPIGFAQRYLLRDNPSWQNSLAVARGPDNAAGIDYFIGEESRIGAGLGPRIIGQLVDDLWDRYPDISAVVVNVAPDNRRSWRALEKTGFARIWTGVIESDDPSDAGLSHVYVRLRDDAEATEPP